MGELKMTKEELKALGLTDEQIGKVDEAYKGFIPKSRFDEVNEAKKKAEETIKERDKQLEALKKSIQKLVNRHSSLRTNYRLEDGKPVQVVHGYQEVSFTKIDVSELDENSLRNLVLEKSREQFDLENGNVFRVFLFSKNLLHLKAYSPNGFYIIGVSQLAS